MKRFLSFMVIVICSFIVLVGCQNQGEIIGVSSPAITQTVMTGQIEEPAPRSFEPQEEIELIYKNVEEGTGDFPEMINQINQYRAEKILSSSIFVKDVTLKK